MAIIGLSVTIPVVTAVNLTCSALLGWFVLRESVTARTAVAIGLLIVAIGLLHLGAGQAHSPAGSPPQPGLIVPALFAAGLAGAVYAVLAVTIRKNVTAHIPPATVIFVITGMGVLSLAPLSLWQVGLWGLLETSPRQFAVMLLAGSLNFLAFLAISRGFRYVSVVRANILNTSQVPLAAIAGMLIFPEPPRLVVLLGIALTVAGTLLVNSPAVKQTQASE
jgi:drug/metabolite transporter (DMT)-like permease